MADDVFHVPGMPLVPCPFSGFHPRLLVKDLARLAFDAAETLVYTIRHAHQDAQIYALKFNPCVFSLLPLAAQLGELHAEDKYGPYHEPRFRGSSPHTCVHSECAGTRSTLLNLLRETIRAA